METQDDQRRLYKGQRRNPISETRRASQYLHVYGITLDEREKIFTKQRGRCAICKNAFDSNALHTDHCHSTGKVRGLLCPNCNHGIGYFHDDPQMLNAAILYLKYPTTANPIYEEGKPCKHCGGTKRYIKNRNCVPCFIKKERQRRENKKLANALL
jgi:hypothetical protein